MDLRPHLDHLKALTVICVGGNTTTLGAGSWAIVADTTALSIEWDATTWVGVGGCLGRTSSGLGRIGVRARAIPDRWAGKGERSVADVDNEIGIWVGGPVCAWEPHHWPWGSVAATGDPDLHAGDVVLWLVNMGAVDTCSLAVK